MRLYETEIADMNVALYDFDASAEGPLPFDFSACADASEADVAVIAASCADEALCRLLDTMEEEGTKATLTALVLGEAPEVMWRVVDFCVVANEKEREQALSDILAMLDYYTYCQPVDVGRLLSGRGTMTYRPLAEATQMAELQRLVAEAVSGAREALVFLRVGEDVWDSEVMMLAEAIEGLSGQTALSVAAVRTLPSRSFFASLFIGA